MKLNRQGQGLMETVLSLPIFMALVLVMAIIIYRSIVFHVADYQAHEALVCASSEGPRFCEQELNARLKKVLLPEAEFTAKVQKAFNGHKVRISIQLLQEPKQLKIPIEIEKTLSGI